MGPQFDDCAGFASGGDPEGERDMRPPGAGAIEQLWRPERRLDLQIGNGVYVHTAISPGLKALGPSGHSSPFFGSRGSRPSLGHGSRCAPETSIGSHVERPMPRRFWKCNWNRRASHEHAMGCDASRCVSYRSSLSERPTGGAISAAATPAEALRRYATASATHTCIDPGVRFAQRK